MTRDELITKCHYHIGAAVGSANTNDHKHFAEHMSTLLDLLIEELVGSPPDATVSPAKHFNPEQILQEVAISIKHRTISDTHRWYIVYYHDRITCVPTPYNVPPEIILHEFTERMVHRGFTSTYWTHLKAKIIDLYKELHK